MGDIASGMLALLNIPKTPLKSSEVVIFTGHQSKGVRWNDSGKGADHHASSLKKKPLTNVKLVIASSCNVLSVRDRDAWNAVFPNAFVLGYKTKSPASQIVKEKGKKRGAHQLRYFLQNLTTVDLSSKAAILKSIIGPWKSHVEFLDPIMGGKRAYMSPEGSVQVYNEKGKKVWR